MWFADFACDWLSLGHLRTMNQRINIKLVWVISPKPNGTRLFNLEPKIHDDLKWTTIRKGLYRWWIGGQLYSIFFKYPLIMHCTGCSCDSARCSLVARLRWTKCPKLKRIPGKDEKRLIDNLGMPGNFKYIKVQLLNYNDNENDNKQGSWGECYNRTNPSVEIEIQRSDYAKSMDEIPKLWHDKAQGSKIQSND